MNLPSLGSSFFSSFLSNLDSEWISSVCVVTLIASVVIPAEAVLFAGCSTGFSASGWVATTGVPIGSALADGYECKALGTYQFLEPRFFQHFVQMPSVQKLLRNFLLEWLNGNDSPVCIFCLSSLALFLLSLFSSWSIFVRTLLSTPPSFPSVSTRCFSNSLFSSILIFPEGLIR